MTSVEGEVPARLKTKLEVDNRKMVHDVRCALVAAT
jgi:hypothetical protein